MYLVTCSGFLEINNAITLNFFEREICYKELAHAIMKAGKPRDLQGEVASWQPKRKLMVSFHPESKGLRMRRADVVVPAQRLAGFRPRKSRCFSWSLN